MHSLAILAFALLAAVALTLCVYLGRGAAYPRAFTVAGLVAAALAQLLTLLVYKNEVRLQFLTTGADFYLLIALALSVLSAVAAGFRQSVIIVLATTTFALCYLGSSSVLVHHAFSPPGETPLSALAVLHIVPALIAELSMISAWVLGAAYLVQGYRLKKNPQLALRDRMPSLSRLETLQQRLLLSGFVLMTISIISGLCWAIAQHKFFMVMAPVPLAAIMSWVLMAVLLIGRNVLLWSPRRCSGVVVLAVTGWYVLVVLSMALLGKGAHG